MVFAKDVTSIPLVCREYRYDTDQALKFLFGESSPARRSCKAIKERCEYLCLPGQGVEEAFFDHSSSAIRWRRRGRELHLQVGKTLDGSEEDKKHLSYTRTLEETATKLRNVRPLSALRDQYSEKVREQDRKTSEESRALFPMPEPASSTTPAVTLSHSAELTSGTNSTHEHRITPATAHRKPATSMHTSSAATPSMTVHQQNSTYTNTNRERFEIISIDGGLMVAQNSLTKYFYFIPLPTLKLNNPLRRCSVGESGRDMSDLINWRFYGRNFSLLLNIWYGCHLGVGSPINAVFWDIRSYRVFFIDAAKFNDLDVVEMIVPPLEESYEVTRGFDHLSGYLARASGDTLQVWEVNGLSLFAARVTKGLVRFASTSQAGGLRAAHSLHNIFEWAHDNDHQYPEICLAILKSTAGHIVEEVLSAHGELWAHPSIN